MKIFIKLINTIFRGKDALFFFVLFTLGFMRVGFSQPVDIYLTPGVNFVSDISSQIKIAPWILQLNSDPQFRDEMELRLQKAVEATKMKKGYRVITRELAQQGSDNYAASFAVSGELISREILDGKSFIQYEIHAQVLVVNFSSIPDRQRLVAAYPIRLRHRTSPEVEPTNAQHLEIFKQMYLRPKVDMGDIVGLWVNRLAGIELSEKDVWIKVMPFRFEEKAKVAIASEVALIPSMTSRLTSNVEGVISSQFNLPIIPSVIGQSTEKGIVVFSNSYGVQKNFKLADPSFILEFSVKDLRSVSNIKKTSAGNDQTDLMYAAALDVNLRDEITRKDSAPFNVTFKKIDGISFLGKRELSKSADFYRLIEGLSSEFLLFVKNSNKSDKWLATSLVFPDKANEVRGAFATLSQQLSARN
jgi:hypothetical protein